MLSYNPNNKWKWQYAAPFFPFIEHHLHLPVYLTEIKPCTSQTNNALLPTLSAVWSPKNFMIVAPWTLTGWQVTVHFVLFIALPDFRNWMDFCAKDLCFETGEIQSQILDIYVLSLGKSKGTAIAVQAWTALCSQEFEAARF